MKTRITFPRPLCLALFAASLLPWVFAGEASAATVTISGPCGGIVNPAPGQLIAGCILADGTVVGAQGGSGTATSNSFLLTVSPVSVSTQGNTNQTFTTMLGMGGPTTVIGTYLRLDGFVTLFNALSTETLILTGMDNANTTLTIKDVFAVVGNCPAGDYCVLQGVKTAIPYNIMNPMFGGPEGGITDWKETLQVQIANGGAYIDDSSDNPFIGVPEPPALLFVVPALIGMFWKLRSTLV